MSFTPQKLSYMSGLQTARSVIRMLMQGLGWGPKPLVRYIMPIDYRDRISIVTWLVIFGMGCSLLIDFRPLELRLNALGSPFSLFFSKTLMAGLFLGILASGGAASIISLHPRFTTSRHFTIRPWIYGALPMAIVLITVLMIPIAPNRLSQVIGLLVSGTLLALTLFCLYATVEEGKPGFRRGRFVLNALAYGAALLLFLQVYGTRTRSLLSATLIAIIALLLAVEILRNVTSQTRIALTYGAISALVLGEVTWALNYWRLSNITGGLVLMLIFYLLLGVAQQGLQKRLHRRVVIEFALVTVAGVVLIVLSAGL